MKLRTLREGGDLRITVDLTNRAEREIGDTVMSGWAFLPLIKSADAGEIIREIGIGTRLFAY
jgi:hypothetical protein